MLLPRNLDDNCLNPPPRTLMPSFDENLEPTGNDNPIGENDIRFQLNGKQVNTSAAALCDPKDGQVAINFGNLLPMLEEAISSRKLWVSDFADEEIRVSSDLYDVIQAFSYFNCE